MLTGWRGRGRCSTDPGSTCRLGHLQHAASAIPAVILPMIEGMAHNAADLRRPPLVETRPSDGSPKGGWTGSRNLALDGIRGLAALSVVVGHCYLGATGLAIWSTRLGDFSAMSPWDVGYRLLGVAFPSDAAVMVFFVLSGHVLWQSFVKKRLDARGLPDYVLSRLWRLLPLIVVVTLMMECLVRAPGLELVQNMLLLRTDLLGVTWSLQVEMVGSVALAAMWLFAGNSKAKLLLVLAVTIAMVPFARGTVLVFLPAFALGGVIGSVPANVWNSRSLFWIGLAVLLTASLFLSHGGLSRCFEMIGATAVIGCMGTRPLRFLQSAPAKFLGAISYPLYLCHPFANEVLNLVVAPSPTMHRMALFAATSALSLLIAVPLSAVLHIAIEWPCMHWRPTLVPGGRRVRANSLSG